MKTIPDTLSNVKQEMSMGQSDMQLAFACTDMQLCLF